MNEKYNEIANLIKNEKTLDEILKLKSTKDFCAYLKDKGIDFTFEETQKVVSSIIEYSQRVEGEMTSENLEQVSGGVAAEAVLKACWEAAKWGWKITKKAGQGFANWEDNGCTISGKKYC